MWLYTRFEYSSKPGDHKFLFDWVANTHSRVEKEVLDEKGYRHCFRYLNGAPLNDANFELEVNVLEYREIAPNGKKQRFSWVTDLPIRDDNLMELMRAARARWKIENETFNTLKNQDYHFEHNFGHGYNHLSTVLMHLMMLAFLIDQIQQRGCRVFQAALSASHTKSGLWRELRSRFDSFRIPNWETLYRSIIQPPAIELTYDTS